MTIFLGGDQWLNRKQTGHCYCKLTFVPWNHLQRAFTDMIPSNSLSSSGRWACRDEPITDYQPHLTDEKTETQRKESTRKLNLSIASISPLLLVFQPTPNFLGPRTLSSCKSFGRQVSLVLSDFPLASGNNTGLPPTPIPFLALRMLDKIFFLEID